MLQRVLGGQRRQGQVGKLRRLAQLLAAGEITFGDADDQQPAPDLPPIRQGGAWAKRAEQQRRASRQEFHLLPECVPALNLWLAVQTQWREGFSGPTGLDYSGVRASPHFRRLPPKEREDVFEDVCTMERAWLTERARIARQKQTLEQGI